MLACAFCTIFCTISLSLSLTIRAASAMGKNIPADNVTLCVPAETTFSPWLISTPSMLVGFLQPHFEICYQTWSKQSGSRSCIYRLPERFPSQLASVSDRWAWHCSCWVVLRCYCKPVSTTATAYPCRAGLSVESLLTPLCEGLRGASPPLLRASSPPSQKIPLPSAAEEIPSCQLDTGWDSCVLLSIQSKAAQ